MKKIAVLLLLVLALAGCGKKTSIFIVDNQSDWRVVVSITNVKELGKKVDKSLYTILKRNDPYSNSAYSNRVVFEVYEGSVCELISVNGAKIKTQTNNMLVLENSQPLNVLVVNKTGRNILLKNDACIRNNLADYFYCGDVEIRDRVTNKTIMFPRYYYVPLFTTPPITTQNTIEHPASIQFYAWQLSQIAEMPDQKMSEAINQLAVETIKITDNWKPLKTYWEKTGDKLYLFLTN
jgi:putative lipoprotein